MKTVRGLHLLPSMALLLTSIVVFTPFTEAQTIRALLVGNANNVPHYAKNMNMIVGLLRETNEVGTVKDRRVDYTTADVTPASEQATKWLEDLRPAGNDVVFVYYSRAEDDEQPDGPDPLDIVEFAKKLHKKPGRLKILITDVGLRNVANADGSDEMEIRLCLNQCSTTCLLNKKLPCISLIDPRANSPSVMLMGGGLHRH